jgi:hypothetical protein
MKKKLNAKSFQFKVVYRNVLDGPIEQKGTVVRHLAITTICAAFNRFVII